MSNPWDSFQQGMMTGQRFGSDLRERRNAREIGGMMSSGDVEGARGLAYQQGDLRTGQAIDRQLSEAERAQAERRTEALAGGIRYLRTVPADQRPQAFAQMRGQLGAIFEPELLDQLAGADMSDQALNAFGAALGEEATRMQLFQTRSGDIVGVNPASGDNRVIYDGPEQQEAAPNGYRWTAEGSLEAIPGGPADTSVVSARAAAGRAPPRGRSSGGGRSGGAPRAAPSSGGGLPPGFTVRRR